jgi:hypothetical protein
MRLVNKTTRLEDNAECILVLIDATREGKKEPRGWGDGDRRLR